MNNLRFKGVLWDFERHSKPDECWIYPGFVNKMGYAAVQMAKNRKVGAHRMSYFLYNGPIPEGLVIDHLCRNRACVNPKHLEAVTQQVNILRGVGLSAQRARMTHCAKGHELVGQNIMFHKNGSCRCRTCDREKTRAFRRQFPERYKMYNHKKYRRAREGIAPQSPPKGEKHHNAKLTETQVIEIIKSDLKGAELAKKYKIGRAAISSIRTGKQWRYLHDRLNHDKLSTTKNISPVAETP